MNRLRERASNLYKWKLMCVEKNPAGFASSTCRHFFRQGLKREFVCIVIRLTFRAIRDFGTKEPEFVQPAVKRGNRNIQPSGKRVVPAGSFAANEIMDASQELVVLHES